MNATVVLQALRLSRRTLIVACLGYGGFLFLSVLGSSLVLDEFAAGARETGFLRDPPRAIEALSGGSLDFFSPVGWIATAVMHPISLTLQTMVALTVAVGVPAEIERGTLDLVLSRPVSRVSYLLSKAAAAAGSVALVQLCGMAVLLLARLTLDGVAEASVAGILRLTAGSFLLFLAFSMLGFLISSRSSLRGRALGLAAGLVVAAFFLNFLGLLFDEVQLIRYLSPFHWFSPADQLTGEASGVNAAVLGTIAVVALLGALRSFSRRDLSS